MASYSSFAAFYDEVQGDRAGDADYAASLLERERPAARRVLELACGTGSVLARLRDRYEMAGVDRSPEMLAVARTKVPDLPLVRGDMTRIRMGETYDAVLCLYDSVNHLLRWEDWEAFFDTAGAHLDQAGVLVFDVNTPRRLSLLVEQTPVIQRFDKNVLVLDVVDAGHDIVNWDIEVFEGLADGMYRRHKETIPELGIRTEQIREALTTRFRRVRVVDAQRSRPTSRSGRLWFVAVGPRTL